MRTKISRLCVVLQEIVVNEAKLVDSAQSSESIFVVDLYSLYKVITILTLMSLMFDNSHVLLCKRVIYIFIFAHQIDLYFYPYIRISYEMSIRDIRLISMVLKFWNKSLEIFLSSYILFYTTFRNQY